MGSHSQVEFALDLRDPTHARTPREGERESERESERERERANERERERARERARYDQNKVSAKPPSLRLKDLLGPVTRVKKKKKKKPPSRAPVLVCTTGKRGRKSERARARERQNLQERGEPP